MYRDEAMTKHNVTISPASGWRVYRYSHTAGRDHSW